jgi:XTP/dITP diphosphohydrolase
MMTFPPRRLLLASGNAHKVRELRDLLGSIPEIGAVEIVTPAAFAMVAEPRETGTTFEENALLKARYWAGVSGLPALADDSGLVVDALDGRPGVLSARYAADTGARNRRVLDELQGVPIEGRGARFVCVAALVDTRGRETLRRGEVEGRIGQTPRGTGGFGYDPIFELTETSYAGRTMAELSAEEKNGISHRGRAMAAIAGALAECLREGRIVKPSRE